MNYILYNIYIYKYKVKKKKKWCVLLICCIYFFWFSSYLFLVFMFFYVVDYCDKLFGYMLFWEVMIWWENYSKLLFVWFFIMGNLLMCRVLINVYIKNDWLMIVNKGRVNNVWLGFNRDWYFFRVVKNVNLSYDCILCVWVIVIFRNGKCNF